MATWPYGHVLSESLSVRELGNGISEVLRRVERGERLTVSAHDAVAPARGTAADCGLLRDLREAWPDTTKLLPTRRGSARECEVRSRIDR